MATLRELCKARGWSIEYLAIKMHVPKSTVQSWENYQKLVTKKILDQLVKFLGEEPDDVVIPAPVWLDNVLSKDTPFPPPPREPSPRSFNEILGRYFTFTKFRPESYDLFPETTRTFKLIGHAKNFLIFTDSAGSIHTFTPAQLASLKSIEPASSQAIEKFNSTHYFLDEFEEIKARLEAYQS